MYATVVFQKKLPTKQALSLIHYINKNINIYDTKYSLRPKIFVFLRLGTATKIDGKLPKYSY
jgi:hypothetical protein